MNEGIRTQSSRVKTNTKEYVQNYYEYYFKMLSKDKRYSIFISGGGGSDTILENI
jgi:hypothetical protein